MTTDKSSEECIVASLLGEDDTTRVNDFDASDIKRQPRPNTAIGLVSTKHTSPDLTDAPTDDVRRQPWYADWYYAQQPRDPRALPPLTSAGGKYGSNRPVSPPPPAGHEPQPIVQQQPQTNPPPQRPPVRPRPTGGRHAANNQGVGGARPHMTDATDNANRMPPSNRFVGNNNNNSPMSNMRMVPAPQPLSAAAIQQTAQQNAFLAAAMRSPMVLPPSPSQLAAMSSSPMATAMAVAAAAAAAAAAAVQQQSPMMQQQPQMVPARQGGRSQQRQQQQLQIAPDSSAYGPPPFLGLSPHNAPAATATTRPLTNNPYATSMAAYNAAYTAAYNTMFSPYAYSALQPNMMPSTPPYPTSMMPAIPNVPTLPPQPEQLQLQGRGRMGAETAVNRRGNTARSGLPPGRNVNSVPATTAGPGHPRRARSDKMESFRASSGSTTWELSDVFGSLKEFSADQEGSRFIQKKLDAASVDQMQTAIMELLPDIISVMTDVFGNYVAQKLFDHGTAAQCHTLAERIRSHVVELTLQTYGCRVIQRAIERISDVDRDALLGELRGNVARCIQDQNGNHVIQKCIQVVPQRCDFIIESFLGRVRELATHAYGCRVVQCSLMNCPKYAERVIQEIADSLMEITQDQYGNYVIQHVLTVGNSAGLVGIRTALRAHFYRMSHHKFSSNVMEKLFSVSPAEERNIILTDLLRIDVIDFNDMEREVQEFADDLKPLKPSCLLVMLKDPFANYVAQKMFEQCNDEQKQMLALHVAPYAEALRRAPSGKHIVSKLERAGLIKPSGNPAESTAAETSSQAVSNQADVGLS